MLPGIKLGFYLYIIEIIYLEDLKVLNVYTSNNGASKCMKQNPIELEAEISNLQV